MKAKITLFLFLCASIFLGNGCTYMVLWKAAKSNYDEDAVDRDIDKIERERQLRMQENSNYRDVEINAVNSSLGAPNYNSNRALTLEELRAQQARERAEREKNKK